jgi:hypothetical protein
MRFPVPTQHFIFMQCLIKQGVRLEGCDLLGWPIEAMGYATTAPSSECELVKNSDLA